MIIKINIKVRIMPKKCFENWFSILPEVKVYLEKLNERFNKSNFPNLGQFMVFIN